MPKLESFLCANILYMEIIELNKLLEIAREQGENEWHFHFLTPECVFNDSGKYKIILETEDKSYAATTYSKPMEELKKIENLFYKR
jgi:hypothetical protein